MTAQLAEAYTTAGNENNALVIPAGLAFARAIGKQPELNLYAPDKRHPSLAGTYLAACTVFAVLTGRSPVGNAYLAGIDAPTAQFLPDGRVGDGAGVFSEVILSLSARVTTSTRFCGARGDRMRRRG
jgi:hypothetical protein